MAAHPHSAARGGVKGRDSKESKGKKMRKEKQAWMKVNAWVSWTCLGDDENKKENTEEGARFKEHQPV